MSLFGFFRNSDINRSIEEFLSTPDGVLLDVRTPEEYNEGHIPKSVNLPLHNIYRAEELFENKSIPLFVYCRSGARSAQAAAELKDLGFSNVKDIGGISAYKGKVEY